MANGGQETLHCYRLFLLNIQLIISLFILTHSRSCRSIHTHKKTPIFLPIYIIGLLVLPYLSRLFFSVSQWICLQAKYLSSAVCWLRRSFNFGDFVLVFRKLKKYIYFFMDQYICCGLKEFFPMITESELFWLEGISGNHPVQPTC